MAFQERTCCKEPGELTAPDPHVWQPPRHSHPFLASPLPTAVLSGGNVDGNFCPIQGSSDRQLWFGEPISLTEAFWEWHCSLCSSNQIILPSPSLFTGIRHAGQSKASPCLILPFISPRHAPSKSLALLFPSWCPLTGGPELMPTNI